MAMLRGSANSDQLLLQTRQFGGGTRVSQRCQGRRKYSLQTKMSSLPVCCNINQCTGPTFYAPNGFAADMTNKRHTKSCVQKLWWRRCYNMISRLLAPSQSLCTHMTQVSSIPFSS